MNVLDRMNLLAQLGDYVAGKASAASLAHWAFEQFYAEVEGEIVYEIGYRRVLVQTLDDLMFGDDPRFKLEQGDVEQLMQRLQTAGYTIDDEAEHEDEHDFDDEGE